MRQDMRLTILRDLARRVDGIAEQRGHVTVPRLQDEVCHIRHLAHSFHIDAVEGLAEMLESALSLHGLDPVILSYLDLIRDAISAEIPVAAKAGMIAARPQHQPLRA